MRDGIVCHYGEKIKRELEPDLGKSPNDLYKTVIGKSRPGTLEGCVARFADKVAYLGQDMEDAITVNLISRNEIPDFDKETLGNTKGKIIGTLVDNIVKNNQKNTRIITLSPDIYKAMQELLTFNNEKIYGYPLVEKYKRNAERTITLFLMNC